MSERTHIPRLGPSPFPTCFVAFVCLSFCAVVQCAVHYSSVQCNVHCLALHAIAWYCIVVHGIVRYCVVLLGYLLVLNTKENFEVRGDVPPNTSLVEAVRSHSLPRDVSAKEQLTPLLCLHHLYFVTFLFSRSICGSLNLTISDMTDIFFE